jgi:beta-phosphoglucomutase-like phosphatase (HAD superfamily)
MAVESKPKAVAPKNGTKRNGNRWTDEQIAMLKEAVDSAETHKAAFDEVAKKLGKNPATVQQKWYAMQRKSITKRAHTRARAQHRSIRAQVQSTDLNKLSDTELVALAQAAAQEIRTRREALEAAEALFAR